MADARRDEARDPSPEGRRAIPTLEWLIGGAGALLVGAIVGYLIYAAVGRDEMPPDVRLLVLEVRQVPEGHLVRIEATNEGSLAASELQIEGEIALPDGTSETSDVTIDYLPPRSKREAAFMFQADPASGVVKLRPKSFTRP